MWIVRHQGRTGKRLVDVLANDTAFDDWDPFMDQGWHPTIRIKGKILRRVLLKCQEIN